MPCPPPGWEWTPMTVSLYLCLFVGSFIILAFALDAFSREASISAEEFQEATSRVLYRASLLTLRHGEELRWLCWVISSDLIRITEYINQEVSRCFYQTGALEDEEKVVAMLELLRISRSTQRSARLAKLAIRFKLPMRLVFEVTAQATEKYISRLPVALHQYCLKHPECADRLPA